MSTARRALARVRTRSLLALCTVTAGLHCSATPPSPAADAGLSPEASTPTPGVTARSSSIVFAPGARTLWVTSPDDDAVVEIDGDSLAEVRRVPVAGAPEQLAWSGDHVLVASLSRGTDVALIDTSTTPPTVTRVPVPCGGTRGLVVEPLNQARVLVACPDDDTVAEVDVLARRTVRAVDAPGRPTALAIEGDRLFVSASRDGVLRTLSLAAIEATVARSAGDTHWPAPVTLAAVTVSQRVLDTDTGHASQQLDALTPVPGANGVAGVYQRVEHDGDRDRPANQGSYGSVVDGAPRIEPRVTSACGGRYAVFDGGADVFSGPSALAYDGAHGRLWVVNRSTDNVAVLTCASDAVGAADDARVPVASAWRVGRGPRGIVLAGDGNTAYVDAGYDHAIARITLGANDAPDVVHDANPVRRREVGASMFSADALRGRNAFDDAVDTHLTPSGIVTCATCHPHGGEDGLSWFLHTPNVPRKLRRSPPAWAARPSLAPFHWDGGFSDAATLTHTTIVELMGGDALLVDTSAIATWLAALPPPVPRPLDDAQRTRAEHGRGLFESSAVGCAGCHSAGVFADGMRHAVVGASSDPDGVLALVDTPTLLGVRARPPYLHDGRAATLTDVLTTHDAGDTHGHTSQLSATDVEDLVWYLRTL